MFLKMIINETYNFLNLKCSKSRTKKTLKVGGLKRFEFEKLQVMFLIILNRSILVILHPIGQKVVSD